MPLARKSYTFQDPIRIFFPFSQNFFFIGTVFLERISAKYLTNFRGIRRSFESVQAEFVVPNMSKIFGIVSFLYEKGPMFE